MRINDLVVRKEDNKNFVYDSDCEMRSVNGERCCGVVCSRVNKHSIETFVCDKDYFINNFEKV